MPFSSTSDPDSSSRAVRSCRPSAEPSAASRWVTRLSRRCSIRVVANCQEPVLSTCVWLMASCAPSAADTSVRGTCRQGASEMESAVIAMRASAAAPAAMEIHGARRTSGVALAWSSRKWIRRASRRPAGMRTCTPSPRKAAFSKAETKTSGGAVSGSAARTANGTNWISPVSPAFDHPGANRPSTKTTLRSSACQKGTAGSGPRPAPVTAGSASVRSASGVRSVYFHSSTNRVGNPSWSRRSKAHIRRATSQAGSGATGRCAAKSAAKPAPGWTERFFMRTPSASRSRAPRPRGPDRRRPSGPAGRPSGCARGPG